MLFGRSVYLFFSSIDFYIWFKKRKERYRGKNKIEKRMFWVKVWITSPIFFRRLEIGTSFFHSLRSIFHSIREHSSIRISITFIFLIFLFFFFFFCLTHFYPSFTFLRIIWTIKGDKHLSKIPFLNVIKIVRTYTKCICSEVIGIRMMQIFILL